MNGTYIFIAAFLLTWLTSLSLLMIGRLAWLQFSEWRKNRRLAQRRAEMILEGPYRPRYSRALAMKPLIIETSLRSSCPKIRQSMTSFGGSPRWNSASSELN